MTVHSPAGFVGLATYKDAPTITAATERQFLATVVPCIRDLRRFAIALTRNSADADDLVQDTLFRAVRKLPCGSRAPT